MIGACDNTPVGEVHDSTACVFPPETVRLVGDEGTSRFLTTESDVSPEIKVVCILERGILVT